MAIPPTPHTVFGAIGEYRTVQQVCRHLDIELARYARCTVTDDVMSGEKAVRFYFKANQLPPKLHTAFADIAQRLDDPLRGEVIRAAVPELHAALMRFREVFDTVSGAFHVTYTSSELRRIMQLDR